VVKHHSAEASGRCAPRMGAASHERRFGEAQTRSQREARLSAVRIGALTALRDIGILEKDLDEALGLVP